MIEFLSDSIKNEKDSHLTNNQKFLLKSNIYIEQSQRGKGGLAKQNKILKQILPSLLELFRIRNIFPIKNFEKASILKSNIVQYIL